MWRKKEKREMQGEKREKWRCKERKRKKTKNERWGERNKKRREED